MLKLYWPRWSRCPLPPGTTRAKTQPSGTWDLRHKISRPPLALAKVTLASPVLTLMVWLLAAIQGLNRKLESELKALKAELNQREVENAELRQRLARLERVIEQLAK